MHNKKHPIDKGWSWMILLGCTINTTLVVGSTRAFGIYFVEFISTFDADVSMTSLINGLLQITYSLVSLLVMTFGLRYISVRQSIFTGGIIVSAAYLIGSFAPNVKFLLFSNGVLFGVGFGLINGPTTYLTSLYFDKRRNLVNTILFSGGGIGGLILPPIYRFLLDLYELRGALLITAGILLHSVAASVLLRPIAFYDLKNKADEENKNGFHTTATSKDICKLKSKPSSRSLQIIENDCFKNQTSKLKRCKSEILKRNKKASITFKHSLSDGRLTSNRISDLDNVLQLKKYKHSNISLPQKIEPENPVSEKHKPVSLKTNKNKTKNINWALLCNPLMIIFVTALSFGSLGGAYGSLYITHFSKDNGIDDMTISLIISSINGCDVAGRVLFGILSDRIVVKNCILVAVSLTACSFNMFLSFLYKEMWSIILFSVIHGLLSGSIVALSPALIIDFLSLDNYRTAMGVALLFQGFAMCAVLPIIGALRDFTDTYVTSFQVLGGCYLLSSALLYFEPCLRKYKIVNDDK